MAEAEREISCPMCGSAEIEVKAETRQLSLPFSEAVTYEARINSCRNCEMEGDFLGQTDKIVAPLLEKARKDSAGNIIEGLVENQDYSMAYMERALELPARTMMRWKAGDISAAALALLRMIGTYPWTIQVAEAGFDPFYATKRLAQESLNAVVGLAELNNLSSKVDIAIRPSRESDVESSLKLSISFEPTEMKEYSGDVGIEGNMNLHSRSIGLSAFDTSANAKREPTKASA